MFSFCISRSLTTALTISELNGFTLTFRMELLVRDHTLVLCLKAALTYKEMQTIQTVADVKQNTSQHH